jgi:peroxiredoxin
MRISRRNTYLIGAAAIVTGIVLIVIALVVLSDDGGGGGNTAGTNGSGNPSRRPGGTSGDTSAGGAQPKTLGAGKRAGAPGFSLPIVQAGTPPVQAQAPIRRASRGGALDLAALKGTPVVLHVWSAECPPCRADARLVQSTWERWGRRGVAFVGLSVDPDEADALRFARQYGLTYPVVHDEAARVAKSYGVERLPATFFISAGGDVVGRVAGSPSVRQMEFGATAARSARAIGSEQGSSSVPLP